MVNSTANEPTDHQTGNAKGPGVIHYSGDSIASVKISFNNLSHKYRT